MIAYEGYNGEDVGGQQADLDFFERERNLWNSISRKDTRKVKNNKGNYLCTKCQKFKPKSAYYSDNRNPNGIRSKCKICYNEDRKR